MGTLAAPCRARASPKPDLMRGQCKRRGALVSASSTAPGQNCGSLWMRSSTTISW